MVTWPAAIHARLHMTYYERKQRKRIAFEKKRKNSYQVRSGDHATWHKLKYMITRIHIGRNKQLVTVKLRGSVRIQEHPC